MYEYLLSEQLQSVHRGHRKDLQEAGAGGGRKQGRVDTEKCMHARYMCRCRGQPLLT